MSDREDGGGIKSPYAHEGWLKQPPTMSREHPEPVSMDRNYDTRSMVSAAAQTQGDKIYCYRIMHPFMGLPKGGCIVVDFNAIDLQAVVLADRRDPESIIGVWSEAQVPLFGIAQDLGVLEWASCSEQAWKLSQRRGSLQCSLEVIEGGA